MRILSLALCVAGCLATKTQTWEIRKLVYELEKVEVKYNLEHEALEPVWEDTLDKTGLTSEVVAALGQFQSDYAKQDGTDTATWQTTMKTSLLGLRGAIDAVPETEAEAHAAAQALLKTLDAAATKTVHVKKSEQKLGEISITVTRQKPRWGLIVPLIILITAATGIACYLIYTQFIVEPRDGKVRGGYRATHDYSDDESSYDGQFYDAEAPDEYERKYEQYDDFSDGDSQDASSEYSSSEEEDDHSDSQDDDLYQEESEGDHCSVDLPAEDFPSYQSRASGTPVDTMA